MGDPPRPSLMPNLQIPEPEMGPVRRALFRLVWPAARRLLGLPRLDEIYQTGVDGFDENPNESFEYWTVEGIGATLEVPDEELDHIPQDVPLLVTANHPYGMFDGIALGALLKARRKDYRVMGNRALTMFPYMVPHMTQVDLAETADARKTNTSAIRACLRHLRSGGCLGMFPAGEVAHRTWGRWSVTDSPWNRTVASLARRDGVHVLPVHFHGHNRPYFHLAGLLSGGLRTMLLPRTLANMTGKVVQVSIGRPVTPDQIAQCQDDRTLTEYLRSRVFMLRSREREKLASPSAPLPRTDGLLPRLSSSDRCAGELMDLPERCLLLESGDLSVYIARSKRIPNIVREIGRLREVAFRAVGEGTGNDVDLDRFDRSYRHLFIWNNKTQEIVGAYRLGLTDEILRAQGLGGLYTRTLFEFGRPLLEEIGPAIELGRSFIQPEYQRTFKPLLLLWKGICRFVYTHPRYRYAFGVVSISNEYDALSKRLMTEFLTTTTMARSLGDLVTARNPHRPEPVTHWDHDQVRVVCTSLESVETLVREIENDRAGVPILVKQYLKLNAKLLAVFNVDREFSDVIDGLMLVDFTDVDRRIGDYYMGAEEIVEFLEFHGIDPEEHRRRFDRPEARGA